MSNINWDVTTRFDSNPPYADDFDALFYQHRGQVVGNSSLGGFLATPGSDSARTANTAYSLDLGDNAFGNGEKKGTSVNWSGYAVETNLANPQAYVFTDVKGSWIVPSVSSNSNQNAYSATWIGIDGYSSKTVEQIGIDQDLVNGKEVYYAWYEMYPKRPVYLDFPISAGDRISAEVKYAGNDTYEMTLNDLNPKTGWSYTTPPLQGSKPTTQSSAEWIVEDFTGQLADFNTVKFTGASATTADGYTGTISDPAWQYDAITMVSKSGVVEAAPTRLSRQGSSFSIDYAANSNNTDGTQFVHDLLAAPDHDGRAQVSAFAQGQHNTENKAVAELQFNPALFTNYISAMAGAQHIGPDTVIPPNAIDHVTLANVTANSLPHSFT